MFGEITAFDCESHETQNTVWKRAEFFLC